MPTPAELMIQGGMAGVNQKNIRHQQALQDAQFNLRTPYVNAQRVFQELPWVATDADSQTTDG
jgi:hypothetical protein